MRDLREFFKQDRLAALLGIELVDYAPGSATVRMTVREQHYNGVSIVHGGALFTLADFAFAVASNSHGTVAVAINANISFIRAVTQGTLTARAEEVSRGNRLATYLVRITDEQDAVVAQFQGTVFRKGDPLPE
ncbi:MAG TPA: hydroxyphenylacetyl-CoA thioesterase PaaI [Phycisphaerae bacterium]|nr:hydroxyphenylacetyl-CoA thioesterase PaaI [Phycisphaerae bacterium]HOJ75324.1 hydroxyphenylacetyl-CoA thioesterase PaaI [Phycisphaerae bacterium]HOM53011.1 hydroxyphenylacetyl-CoA thioesterase PaaI [Phycisphaerae bacterium]HON66664.1 hydroxyphenylacetyl-CoA thioesterase PaaI [Phycisphaerae bacterium]HOQ87380.1 hydroxyphenylacetyl-CoA thioesterase PaaI [Phycisphaerae bacterium]